MTVASRLPAVLATAVGLSLMAATAHAAPVGRWIGQDGHDLVGQFPQAGKSDVQDIHLALTGLPPGARIVATTVKAEGGGLWKSDGQPSSWMALAVKAPGAATADVYIEPYQPESGRTFWVELTLDDGQSHTIAIRGGKADPNLRTLAARMEPRWIGQDQHDHATSSANVGPDGVQDVHLAFKKLSPKEVVKSILVAGPGDSRWLSGPNPDARPGAEFVRNPADPTSGDLYFHPSRDLAGQSLKITLTYASGKIDTAVIPGGKCDPALKMPQAAAPVVTIRPIRATWRGQTRGQGGPGSAPGDVRVDLDGLPASASSRIVAASMGDGVVGWWADRKVEGLDDALPLSLRRGSDPTTAELSFPPVRDESGSTLTLRLTFADGRTVISEFPGGPCDPAQRAPAPDGSSIRATPGDDLNDLANRHGTVTLAAGTYHLSRPLILERPVTITSDGGATLMFAQAPSEPAWTAAIKVRCGRTTLDRLTIRFAGPVRWDHDVSYGPAVIGTTDNRDAPRAATLAGLAFTRLDAQAPPASTDWEESPRVLRLVGALNGRIEDNVFQGGLVELWGGPWRFVNNRHDGTPARTFTYSVLSAHELHDVQIVGNRARPLDPTGKTWRWLVMTTRGMNVRVADNVIEGVGPRDLDKTPHPNSPETILTESYRLHFEGKTTGVSTDGRVVTIPRPQGGPASVGAVVSILSGPDAGQWRRIALPLGPNSYVLDRPVTLGGGAISIAQGFVGTTFENNAIDDRGSKVCIPFVLAGDHFGTRLTKNRTLGGDVSFRIVSSSTESPGPWGWSHNPMLGLVLDRNTFEDAWAGATLGVEHGEHNRANTGRVYMTAALTENTFVWSDAYLSAFARDNRGKSPVAVEIGWKTSVDPGEIVVVETGNQRVGGRPGPSAKVFMTTLNGTPVKETSLSFATTGQSPTGGSASRGPSSRR